MTTKAIMTEHKAVKVANTGVVFRRTLRDTRRGMLIWGLSMAMLSFFVTVVYPLIEGFEEINAMMDSMMENPFFQSFFAGMGDMAELDFTSPEGFLGVEFFLWAPLILAVYGVLAGLNVVASEEERGILDVLLSAPVSRRQVIVEKAGVFLVNLALVLALTFLGFVVALVITPDLEISLGRLAEAVIYTAPMILLVAALALFFSTVLRSRSRAGAVTAGIIVGSYFLNSMGGLAGGVLEQLRGVSMFYYYVPVNVLKNGIAWSDFLLLSAVAAIFFGLSLYFFERRDLSV